MTVTHTTTVNDLLALPESGRWYELIEGELHKMSPSNLRHGGLALRIGSVLLAHVRPKGLGQVFVEPGFILAREPDTLVAPDVAFIRQDRLPPGDPPERFYEGPPDLAIEIVSPNDRANEIEQKIQLYLRHGATAVWVISPRTRTITVHHAGGQARRLRETDTIAEPELLPGFSSTVADLLDA